MSKNINDINHLEAKRRILAAIGGRGYDALANQRSKAPPEAIDLGSEEDEPELDAYRAPLGGVELPPPASLAPYAPASLVPADPAERGRYVLAGYLAGRVSPNTRSTMANALARVARLLDTTPERVLWHELRFEHCDAIRAKLLNGGYATATVMLTLEALKGVLHQAKRAKLMTREQFDEATDWGRIKGEVLPAGRELTQEELGKIHAYLASLDDSAYGCFLRATFALLFGVGLRAIEICGATIAGYDAARALLIVKRKGGKLAEVPLGEPERRAIDAWLLERKSFAKRFDSPALLLRVHRNDWVRPSAVECSEKYLREVCKHVARAAHTAHFSPHDLRRTFCTRALRRFDPLTVQTWMGHSKPETTRRYDRRGPEERAAARRTWDIWGEPDAGPRAPTLALPMVPRAND